MSREHVFKVRVTEEEREQLQQLAEAEHEAASILIRRWVRQHHEARFGDVKNARKR